MRFSDSELDAQANSDIIVYLSQHRTKFFVDI